MSPSDHPVKRTRARGPKVRTGCMTCKERKVKCDERKPTCLRCEKAGFECHGYMDRIKLVKQGTRPIFPKSQFDPTSSEKGVSTAICSIRPHRRPLAIAKRPTEKSKSGAITSLENLMQSYNTYSVLDLHFSISNSRFKNQQEYLYYQYFCNHVAGALSGCMPSSFWNHLLLQVSDSESFLRDILAAIGAMHKITQAAAHLRDWDAHQKYQADHQFALEKYHESLRYMRKAISYGQMDPKVALIGSLLTVLFENACGHRDVALVNALSSLKLLQSCTRSTMESGKLSRRFITSGPQVTKDIEDDLSHLFYRLDINASLFVDYRPAEEHWNLREDGQEVLDIMPPNFSTLCEATSFADPIMNRAWHFMRTVQSLGIDPNFQPKPLECPDRWKDIQVRYGWNPWTDSNEVVPQEWVDETKRCANEMEWWITAFIPLFHQLQVSSESNQREYIRSALLFFQAKICLVSIYGAVFTRETNWDAYLSEYQEAISYAEIYFGLKPVQLGYTFDNETTIWLYLLVCKCRDLSIRKRAMKLLRDTPKRDGSWDTRFAIKVCQWVIDIEQAGRGGDLEMCDIVEEERVRVFRLDYDSVEGSMLFYCSQGAGAQQRIHQHLWSGN